jgi:hypothetical protein
MAVVFFLTESGKTSFRSLLDSITEIVGKKFIRAGGCSSVTELLLTLCTLGVQFPKPQKKKKKKKPKSWTNPSIAMLLIKEVHAFSCLKLELKFSSFQQQMFLNIS